MRIAFFSSRIVALICFVTISHVFSSGPFKRAVSLLEEQNTASVMVRTLHESSETMAYEYMVPAPEFESVTYQRVDGQGTVRCKLGNAAIYSNPGQPEIPFIISRLFLPQGKTVESITVSPGEMVTVPQKHLLAWGEFPHPLPSTEITWAKPDRSIYDSDKEFPGKTHELFSIQYRCGVAIAILHIYPVVYNPQSGTVSYFKTFTVEVRTKESRNEGTGVRVDLAMARTKALTEENPGILQTYTDGVIEGDYQNILCNPAEEFKWVAITSNSIISASTTPSLNDLVNQRKKDGLTCKIVSIEDITSYYPGERSPEKLRNFIKDAYNNWKTKFILLGGDTPIIPLKTVRCSHGSTTDNLPTDMPYQCLDGTTWNNDYEAEVFIGRISAGNATEFSNQVYKILAYENDPSDASYLKTGISAAEKLDNNTYGKAAMNELAGYFSSDWNFDGLFDKDGSWSKSKLIQMINTNKYSLINHLGHCNYNIAMKIRNGDETQFKNTKFLFVKSQGCIPGAFDRDCIGERFTTTNRNGMFALVFNSRYGWYQPGNPTGGTSHQLHRAFWKAAWEKDMTYYSEFNEYSHRTNTRYRWDILISNYFGDPATPFRGKKAPSVVSLSSPNGGEILQQNREYKISWSDNFNDNVKIELLKGTSVAKTIASSVSSNGAYVWKIAQDVAAGKYKIRVSSTADPNVRDESDTEFQIIEEVVIAKFPYIQNFNTFDTGTVLRDFWDQITTDSIQWTAWTGKTPSKKQNGKTGPDGDHTSGSGKYLYVESSEPNYPNKTAEILTPIFNLASLKKPEISFWCHMFSDTTNNIGELWVDIKVGNTWENNVLHLSNDHGDKWFSNKIDAEKYAGKKIQVKFRVKTGNGPLGDICIDDFSINNRPVFTSNAVTKAYEGIEYTYEIKSEDDQDSLKLEGKELPSWLKLTDNGDGSGVLKGKPGSIDIGDHKVVLALTDFVITEPVEQSFTITVGKNAAPEFTSDPELKAQEGKEYSYKISAEDSDQNAELTIRAKEKPDWLDFKDNGDGTALLSGTPGQDDVGEQDVVLTVTDNIITHDVTQEFTIIVSETGIVKAKVEPGYKQIVVTPNPVNVASPVVKFFLMNTDNAQYATIYVYDSNGNLLFQSSKAHCNGKKCTIGTWNLRNKNGRGAIVANGTYAVLVKLEMADGSQKALKVMVGVEE